MFVVSCLLFKIVVYLIYKIIKWKLRNEESTKYTSNNQFFLYFLKTLN